MLMDLELAKIILRIVPFVAGPLFGYLFFEYGEKPNLLKGVNTPHEATITKIEPDLKEKNKYYIYYKFEVKGRSHSGSYPEFYVRHPEMFQIGDKYILYSNETGDRLPTSERNYKMQCRIFRVLFMSYVTVMLTAIVYFWISRW